ncbi:MAG: bifunctional phosphoglucose/phosphomannose isomerase [Microgenomates group bacterium]
MTLDDKAYIQKIDSSNMIGSIEMLGKQIQQTWDEVSALPLPDSFKEIKNIVFVGMGGSALGAHIFKNLYASSISVPFEIVSDYNLPSYVNASTLVVAGSYSGTTEEVLSCFDQAITKTKKIIVISSGGGLEERAHENSIPFYKIDPKFNPCNQPRMGIGYSIFALLTFLHTLGVITITESELSEIDLCIQKNNEQFGLSAHSETNVAKQIAFVSHEQVPILIAGEHLVGAIHASRNQINENAKSLAFYFAIPELNHHLLEGLKFPTSNNDHYVLIHSKEYSPKIVKRMEITKDVLIKSGHEITEVTAQGNSKLAQVIQTVHFGSYIGFYLSMLYGIDPSPIPNVENFKKDLVN